MTENLTKIYEGADLSGAATGVIYLPVLKNCTLIGLDVLTDEAVSGDVIFSLLINGAELGGEDLALAENESITIPAGEKSVSLSGLTVELSKLDEITLDLVSGSVSSPLTLNLITNDGQSAGGGGVSLPAYWAKFDAVSEFQTDGQNATGWADGSGNGRDAVNGTTAPVKRISGGVHYFDFSDGGWFVLPSMAALKKVDIFFVLKTDADPAVGVTGRLHNLGGTGDNYYPFTDGLIYDGSGSTARHSIGTVNSFVKTALHCFNVSSEREFWTARLNGEVFHYATGNATQFESVPMIGKAGASGTFAGRVAGIYIFDKILTPDQRELLHAQVNTDFGITIY